MKTTKVIAVLFGLTLLFSIGCKESLDELVIIEQNDTLSNTFYTKTVSLDQIPEIASFFESKTRKGIFSAKGGNNALFDVQNIMEVIDTLQNTNYSFNFTFEDTPKNIIYNLILGVDSLGQKTTPIVLKFTSAAEYFDEWAESGYNFANFNGTLNQHRYTDFFEGGYFSKGDCSEHDQFGDPIPCQNEEITNGGLNNSGSSASSGSGAPSGSSSGCSYNSYFHACGGSNQYTSHDGNTPTNSNSCGGDGGGSYWVLEVSCPNGGAESQQKSFNGDCEDCNSGPSGGVGIISNPKSVFLLENELKNNPFALIEIDCDQVRNWQSLAQHSPPKSVKDKVKYLQGNHEDILGDWDIQELEEANGKIVNLDYFSVNITTFPINPETGQKFSPQEFLDFFRRNINDFVKGTNFEPYCEISEICQQEINLWNSSNPIGSIVKLDISMYSGPGGNTLGNDGVVICSEYNGNFWRFMTMEAPYDSSHPVTGTRQFGIEKMPNGSYNIYVRGVDRFSSRLQELIADTFLDNQFQFADNLWESFQEKTNDFINSNGGSSVSNSPVYYRPNWEKLKKVLQGERPISDLGCN